MPYTKLRSHHCYKTHITSVIYTFLPTLPILIRCFILYLCDIYAPQANKNNNSKSYSKVRNEDVHSTLFVVFHQIIEYALLATYYLLKAIKTSLSSFFRYQNLISFYNPGQTYQYIHISLLRKSPKYFYCNCNHSLQIHLNEILIHVNRLKLISY